MKKLLFTLFALMTTMAANAFEFDGINLNGKVMSISRQISAKGYSHDPESNSLRGFCQGTELYLSYNLTDVNEKGHVGLFIVDIVEKEPNAIEVMKNTFNIIYHVVSTTDDSRTYEVDKDGTTMTIMKGPKGVRLCYKTPYYKAPKK